MESDLGSVCATPLVDTTQSIDMNHFVEIGKMRVGIDASNIRDGGGLTHLVEMLSAVRPEQHGIEKVLVWSGRSILDKLPQRPWLRLIHDPLLDGPLPSRLFWQRFRLTGLAMHNCELLFVPGGTYVGSFRPFVTMSRNLLPFDPDERRRYGLSWRHLRYILLESMQSNTFRRASGVIFLTQIARQVVERRIGLIPGKVAIVPHGISKSFQRPPQNQYPLSVYSVNRPFRWLYVSVVNFYKHQWHVAEAIARLRQKGIPVELELVGPAYPPALDRLREVISKIDPKEEFIHYVGPVPYQKLASHYHHADGFVFASSCETFGQILLEAMASGLPIACSNRSAMPEILGDAGVYFDPENLREIVEALYTLMVAPDLRKRLAQAAYERALQYSWERCARETFSFLADVARGASVKDG